MGKRILCGLPDCRVIPPGKSWQVVYDRTVTPAQPYAIIERERDSIGASRIITPIEDPEVAQYLVHLRCMVGELCKSKEEGA